MILLLGSSGYLGSAFARELRWRGLGWVTTSHKIATEYVRYGDNIELVICCAAFIPPESVSLCDQHQAETILGNVILPALLSQVCADRGIPLAHICTGCLWNDGKEHREDDLPQRAFTGHCGFYIGTKVMAEEEVRKNHQHYIWRIRLPFDEHDSPRNYLSKLATFPEVWDHENTIAHRGDFVKACLDMWQLKAPWGTYHVMNPGSVKASAIVYRMMELGIRKTAPKIVPGAQGGALVNVDKLLATGVKMRPVEDALTESLNNWKSQRQ